MDRRHQLSSDYSEQRAYEPKMGHLGGRPLTLQRVGGGWAEGAEPRAVLATRVFQAGREGQGGVRAGARVTSQTRTGTLMLKPGRRKLEGLTLSETSQSQGDNRCVIRSHGPPEDSDAQRVEGTGLVFMGTEFLFGNMKISVDGGGCMSVITAPEMST